MRLREGWIAVAFALGGVLVYLAIGWDYDSPHDYYGRLADAFVHGRWWLIDAPSWLNELLPCGTDRWCVVYPPLPAVLSIPFLPFGSPALAEALASRVTAGLSGGPLYLALRGYGAPRIVAGTGVILSLVGTTLLFTGADGRTWYAAHSVAVLFACVAFWLAARGGPSWGVGVAMGLAGLARLPVVAATPALALLLARRSARPYLRTLLGIAGAGIPFAVMYFGYDLMRWGTIFDVGYLKLIEGDYFFPYGLFSPVYLLRHIRAIFFAMPDIVPGVPWFVRPRWEGMSLFITTPAFLWVFASVRGMRRSIAVTATALAAVLALLPDVLHGTYGFQQFGYRFSLDAQPFLVALALTGDAFVGGVWRRWPSWLFAIAVLFAMVMNIYGAIAIMRFGYWQ